MASDDKRFFVCSSCGGVNRVPADRIQSGPNCGRCKNKLDTSGMPINVTDGTFDSLIKTAPVPVLVDVWAPWCGPCRMIGPLLEEIGQEMTGQVIIAKLNSDENPQTSRLLKIRSIPALFVYKNGAKVESKVGALPKAQIKGLLTPHLA